MADTAAGVVRAAMALPSGIAFVTAEGSGHAKPGSAMNSGREASAALSAGSYSVAGVELPGTATVRVRGGGEAAALTAAATGCSARHASASASLSASAARAGIALPKWVLQRSPPLG